MDALASPGPPPPVALPPGRHLDLPGRGRTFVRDQPGPPGAPTVVLLHGWTVTADINWYTSYAALAPWFRVVAIDHRGHGRGIRSTERFRLADCADDVVAATDALGIDRFVAVGYSMGGPIAQLAWHRHPERVAGLVLCATSRNFRGKPRERAVFGLLDGLGPAARVTPPRVRQRVADRILTRRPVDPALGAWLRSEFRLGDPRAIVQAGGAIGRFSSHDWIGGIDVPTAVVVTTQDRIVPPHRQQRLATAIAGARTFPVDGDHGVCVADPGAFVPVLVDACRWVTGR